MINLTQREIQVLQYLDPLMHASSRQIGEHIWSQHKTGRSNLRRSNLIGIGAAYCGRLRKLGFVTRLPEIGLWRITEAGRNSIVSQT